MVRALFLAGLLFAAAPDDPRVDEASRLQALFDRNALPMDQTERLARLKLELDSADAAESDRRWARVKAAVERGKADLVRIDEADPEKAWPNDLWIQRRAEAKDPLAKELFLRAARDQMRLSFEPDLKGVELEAFWIARRPDLRKPVVDNTEWLKGVLDRIGWFDISRFGESASLAAWLLVQHSDHDLAFQRTVLERLRAKVAAGEAQPRHLAYLVDRVAVNAGEPQTYGTQGQCRGPGDWQPLPLVDPDRLDARRADVGLEPIAAYRARFECP
jgi:hypothetical protein